MPSVTIKKSEFDTVYHETYGKLYAIFLKISRDEFITKDILQQAYIRLWNRWEDITDVDNLYALLFTYAKHIFIDEIRKKNSRRNAESGLLATDSSTNADDIVLEKETSAIITSIVNKMPGRRKQVFSLSRGEGLSHKKIASLLSLSPHTVERHIQDALAMLKREMKSMM